MQKMRALKMTLALAATLIVTQYIPVYYNTLEFNDFVRQEVMRAKNAGQLKQAVLREAQVYSLPISESDIDITTTGSVLRVSVDYTVPVSLFVYTPHLKFQTGGSSFKY